MIYSTINKMFNHINIDIRNLDKNTSYYVIFIT